MEWIWSVMHWRAADSCYIGGEWWRQRTRVTRIGHVRTATAASAAAAADDDDDDDGVEG
jgi:hypothetical protein